jgi:predicted MFS family arabinose efflux permease
VVAAVKASDSQGRPLEPSAFALLAIQCVLNVGSLSFGVFPLLVDGFVRLAHFDVESAGWCITAEMVGQSVGAALGLMTVRRVGSRNVVIVALVLMIVGNGLTIVVPSSFRWLLALRALAGAGCGLTVVCIGLLAATRHAARNFAIFNMATVLSPAAFAAAMPLLFRVLGVGGVFAVIAGSAALCLGMIPLIPDSRGERTQRREKPAVASTSFIQSVLTCTMTVTYFVSLTMFWSYAGNVGAGHHLGVEAVSSAVGESWLVGGVSGTLAAMLVAKRVPLTFTIIVSAIGGAAGTYAAIMVGSEVAFSFVLTAFVFFWNVMYPIQMGLFAEVDPSGQLAMLAWFVQLIACAIGPALGGFVLHVSSYNVLGLGCALGYLLFVAATLMLAPMARRSSARVS